MPTQATKSIRENNFPTLKKKSRFRTLPSIMEREQLFPPPSSKESPMAKHQIFD